MILPSDKEYTQTKRIIQGIETMKPEFVPLAEWIDKVYDVKTVNIIYDTVNDKNNNKIPRVQICFEFEKEKNKFFTNDIYYSFDKEKQKAIGKKFSEIIKKQGLSDTTNLFLNIFRDNKKGHYLTENVFVIYGAFESVAKIEAAYKISSQQRDEFQKSFNNSGIWTILIGFTIPTFFMYTDEKVKEYDKLEIKREWAEKYYELINPFDEFNYFKRENIQILLNSKENFDNNYQSNWFYYYK